MAKYKELYERKFETRVAVITGFSSDEYCATLNFQCVPQTVLLQIADELVNGGYCRNAEVICDRIELLEPDRMMCEFDGLNRFVKEALGELNYELSE